MGRFAKRYGGHGTRLPPIPSARWGSRLFVLQEPRTLVWWGGFKGPRPGRHHRVPHTIAPDWEGRGLATAAVRELLGEAFARPEVQAVVAHALAEPGPSARVLEKAGFVREGEVRDDNVGQAWRLRIDRASHDSRACECLHGCPT